MRDSLSQSQHALITQKNMKISFMLFGILTLVVLVQGQEGPDYISIDCGAPHDYHDDSSDIYFKTDAGFVDTGENMQVSSKHFSEIYNQQSKNLRSFPSGTRNCYTLRPKQGKGNTYLVRAWFRYGNYDGENQTPVFHLYIDTNFWSTVNYTSYLYKEVIYAAPRDYIQVCLVNIGLGVPFITVLDLRLLDNSTYKVPISRALYTKWRFNIGLTTATIRHPQDVYDRIWSNKTFTSWTSLTNTTPVATATMNSAYKVPQEVLMTAQQTSDVNETFDVFWTSKPGYVWYAYFHFAEVEALLGQVREMDIYMMDKYVDTVSLQNQLPLTVVSVPATGQRIEFTLKATARSDLPPLLNALEIFTVLNLPNSQTDLDDFDGINDIKTAYGIVKENWQGDPCVPENMTWEGLNCSYDNHVPRIISLNLSASNLTGTIATSFSNLTAITSLDLSNNGLTGPLPEFFAQMPNLKFLNLSGNQLSGSIPDQLKKRQQDGKIQLSFGDNLLCESESCQSTYTHKKKSIVMPVVASVVSVIALVILGIFVTFWRIDKKRNKQATKTWATSATSVSSAATKQGALNVSKNRPFASSELLRMTDNFRLVIGEGGFGKVYLGTLEDGCTKVAIKMLSKSSKQGFKEFHAEAELLMVVHHRNLVSFFGYCNEFENMALVYEYMNNGDLKQHLSANNPKVLSWGTRLKIAVDAAQGLEYLHNGCKPPIIHRDLKTSNILISGNMQAKIADLGLSKAFESDLQTHITTCPAGTLGYLDPEFYASGNLTKKSDVYSFGVILLEIITGEPAITRSLQGSTHILHLVAPLLQRGDIQSIVDRRLNGDFDSNSAWKAVEIAMSCVSANASQRPDMSLVLSELKECSTGASNNSSGSRVGDGIYRKANDSFHMTSTEFGVAPSAR